MLKGCKGADTALVLANEFDLAHLLQKLLRPDAKVLVRGHEEPKLACEVEIVLVVRRGRQQDAIAVVLLNVVGNDLVRLALAVPKVVALVEDDQAISAQFRKLADHLRIREDPAGRHTVLMTVVLPHRDDVQRAEDQRFQEQVVRQDPGERRGHQGLPQADHVSEEDAAAFVDMMGRDFHGRDLEVEEPVAEVLWDGVLDDAFPRLLREVVGHLHVDMVRRDCVWPGPALVDDVGDLLRDVDAPMVGPSVFKPLRELVAGVVVRDVDVQLALL